MIGCEPRRRQANRKDIAQEKRNPRTLSDYRIKENKETEKKGIGDCLPGHSMLQRHRALVVSTTAVVLQVFCNRCVHSFAAPTASSIMSSSSSSNGLGRKLHKSPFLKDNGDTAAAAKEQTALIILNAPIDTPPSPLFRALWDCTNFHICADGGANRLLRADPSYYPDVICGDLDSLLPETRDYYLTHNPQTTIEQDPDQNKNDLDKALTIAKRQNYRRCFVYGAFGGRLDQEMQCLSALYRWRSQFDTLWLYDDHTVAFLCPANCENVIEMAWGNDRTIGEGPTCGIIPVGAKCETLTLRGFQWNLKDRSSEFGGLISTSNRIVESSVMVTASHDVVFTAEVVSGSTNAWTK